MRTLIISLIFTLALGTQVLSQDGFCDGVSATCNGGSDGYVELDLNSIYFFCCGNYTPWGGV